MKPDLGSIFSRAVLRSLGTVAGAAIAVVVGALLTTLQLGEALAIAVLAACLPWAMARSYLWQAVFLTPLIMLLIDAVVPHESVLDISEARLITTVIGGLIVVFGYLIWPSQRHPRVDVAFAAAIEAFAAYLRGVADGAAAERVTAERRRAYRRLFDTRVRLQRACCRSRRRPVPRPGPGFRSHHRRRADRRPDHGRYLGVAAAGAQGRSGRGRRRTR